MKRALLALTLLIAATAQAQSLDPLAPLRAYAAKVLPTCPGGIMTLAPAGPGPSNFNAYQVTLRSDDKYCGAQKYLLHAPKSGQILVGSVIPLPEDSRPAAARIEDQAAQMLKQKFKVTVAPFPLQDGLKSVRIARDTQYGPFAYMAFTDASEKFLIVGFRGSLSTDPAQTIREAIGTATAARRGSTTSKVQIVELSDFQCPTCARAHEKIEPLIQKNLSKLNYTRVDLPLFEHHEWSIAAAMGARAMQKVAPAKYWSYVDFVFKNQETIGKRPFEQVLKEFCEDNDIAWTAVQPIFASKADRTALLDQVSRAFAVGVNSTPTFIINGQIVGFGPEGTFTINAIKSALGVK